MCKKRILTLNEVLLHRRDRIKYQEITLAGLKVLKPILTEYGGQELSSTLKKLTREAIESAVAPMGPDVRFQCFERTQDLKILVWVQFDLLARKSIETIGFRIARIESRAGSYHDVTIPGKLLIMEIRERDAELTLEKLKGKDAVDYRNMVTIWNQAWLNVKRISEQAVDLGLAKVFAPK